MKVWGRAILLILSLSSVLGTLRADFNKHHVFNPNWPAHAKFHAAALAILIIVLGIGVSFVLVFLPFGWRASMQIASTLLFLMGASLLLATTLPGTSPIARKSEPIWMQIPFSIWMCILFAVMTAVGAFLSLTQ